MKLHEVLARIAEPVLGSSAHECYLLQRALQHDSQWPKGPRGPGGGPDATPTTLALVLLSSMVKDPKRDIGHRTYAYYGLPTEGTKRAGWGTEDSPPALRVGKRCGLTKAPTFGGAIERIVRDVKLARRVQTVELVQDWNEAVICWGPRSKIQTSRFMDGQGAIAKNNANALGTLRSTSRIEGKALVAMAEELSEDV